jgi:methionyl aminopeptidase
MTRQIIPLKKPDDIKRIRDAGRIAAEIFNELFSSPLESQTTWEIDSFIDSRIVKRGARSAFKTVRGYNYASCISINEEIVHGVPSRKRKLRSGDIVKVDIGTALHGYFSDSCRTIKIGTVSPGADHLVDTTMKALERAIALMVPGNSLGDIGSAVENTAVSMGFSVVRSLTGHGTGFSLHEPPVVLNYGTPGTGVTLVEGMVLALEPIINEGTAVVRFHENGWTAVTGDGKLSAHFENTVAVTGSGPLVLTD